MACADARPRRDRSGSGDRTRLSRALCRRRGISTHSMAGITVVAVARRPVRAGVGWGGVGRLCPTWLASAATTSRAPSPPNRPRPLASGSDLSGGRPWDDPVEANTQV